jgi:alpha-glucosidase
VCLVNLSGGPVPLPEGQLLLASEPVDGGRLPADGAVWLSA